MRLLDRHIVNEYVRALIGVAFILTVLMLVSIILEHIDDVVENHAGLWVSLKWFVLQLPYKLVQTIPIMVLLAVMFSIGNLSRHNEIIAIVSTGVSRARTRASRYPFSPSRCSIAASARRSTEKSIGCPRRTSALAWESRSRMPVSVTAFMPT